MIDTVLSLIALVILSPLLLITALAVKISSPGPVLFKQQRLGLHGKVFTIYKFRSMTDGAEHTGSGVYSGKGDPRVTKVGKLIRATSIDELPQLINIIVGDMAIVGPRPPLTYHPWPGDMVGLHRIHPALTLCLPQHLHVDEDTVNACICRDFRNRRIVCDIHEFQHLISLRPSRRY